MILQSHFWIPKENGIRKRCLHAYVDYSIIHNDQGMKITWESISGWTGKEDMEYTYNGILFGHEKEGNPAICNDIDVPWGHYAK